MRIVLHYQKKWLFPTKNGKASVLCTKGTPEAFLSSLGAEKYDLADTGTNTYLADISLFAKPLPAHFMLFDAMPAFLNDTDKEAFEHVLTFIAECRETLAALLGKTVNVVIDRKIGTRHPKRPDTVYPINYGYLEDILSADGEGADAYIMGVFEPIEAYCGRVIAIVHRSDDIEDKLVVAPEGKTYTAKEIEAAIHFQEVAYKHTLSLT